jgi:hypothetical protein
VGDPARIACLIRLMYEAVVDMPDLPAVGAIALVPALEVHDSHDRRTLQAEARLRSHYERAQL